MTARLSCDERMDRRIDAMMRRDDKAFAKLEKREEAADRMIGELVNGRCYVWPVGGRYREGTRLELVQFLIRNNYA